MHQLCSSQQPAASCVTLNTTCRRSSSDSTVRLFSVVLAAFPAAAAGASLASGSAASLCIIKHPFLSHIQALNWHLIRAVEGVGVEQQLRQLLQATRQGPCVDAADWPYASCGKNGISW
jgi:hypothetical protein